MFRILPPLLAVGSYFAGRYHVLWDGSGWVLIPMLGSVILCGVAFAMGEDLQNCHRR